MAEIFVYDFGQKLAFKVKTLAKGIQFRQENLVKQMEKLTFRKKKEIKEVLKDSHFLEWRSEFSLSFCLFVCLF